MLHNISRSHYNMFDIISLSCYWPSVKAVLGNITQVAFVVFDKEAIAILKFLKLIKLRLWLGVFRRLRYMVFVAAFI